MIYFQRPEPGKTYYYKVNLDRTLFGDYMITRCWGVSDSKKGGSDTHRFETIAEVVIFLHSTRKRRRQRGYRCTLINESRFNTSRLAGILKCW